MRIILHFWRNITVNLRKDRVMHGLVTVKRSTRSCTMQCTDITINSSQEMHRYTMTNGVVSVKFMINVMEILIIRMFTLIILDILFTTLLPQGSYREVLVKFKEFSRTSQDYFTVVKD